jgi:hypothetical protein
MYANSTSFTPANSKLNQAASPSLGSTLPTPLLHQLHAGIQQPLMKNKPAKHSGLPDQPDRASMRKRRDQDQIALCELQRSRGIEPPENPHTALLEAYGYRQLMQLVFDIPSIGAKAIGAVSNAISFRLGPPGADAASVSAERQSTDAFARKHNGVFRVTLNKLAKSRQDMSGVTVLVVESPADKTSQRNVAAILSDYKKQSSKRFFIEGGLEDICKSRADIYGLNLSERQLMEKGSFRFSTMEKADKKVYVNLVGCLAEMQTFVPALRHEPTPDSTAAAHDLFVRYIPKISATDRRKIYGRLKAVTVAMQDFTKLATQTNAERAKDMAKFIRENRSTDGVNYVLISKGQEEYLPGLLTDLPCIVLGSTPASDDPQYVELKPSDQQKQEL